MPHPPRFGKRKFCRNGGGGWIRTIELIEGRFTVCCGWPLRYPTTGTLQENQAFGGAEGIRTLDPYVANVMLYQLSYCPKRHFS